MQVSNNGIIYQEGSIYNATDGSGKKWVMRGNTWVEITEKKTMFKEIANDTKDFVKENRVIIYWVAVLFLADHFFFKGAFKDRLHAMVQKMLGKMETHIEEKKL